MPLVNMKDMLQHAYDNHYAVGAFDLVSLDFLQGIMKAAEDCRAPVILSLAESHFDYFDFDLLMPAVEAAAKRATVPVAIHLDHGESLQSAIHAINRGCTGVMVDASQADLTENIRLTRDIVSMAQGCGVPVEGELGYVPGVEGEDAERHPGEITFTSVADARTYVQETGIDFLAVSIGTVHGRMQGEPRLNFERLEQINAALQIPLVIHGGTGLSDAQFKGLIANGVSKINYYTALADAAGAAVIDNTSQDTKTYTALVDNISDTVANETKRCMILWGAAGRADEVLATSQPWFPVEHVIIYNVQGLDEISTNVMMAEGQKVLAAIPGVREVITGEALTENADYQYCWIMYFCHPAVIDSFREHPDHVAFANKLFRPVAAKRISIDYQTTRWQVGK